MYRPAGQSQMQRPPFSGNRVSTPQTQQSRQAQFQQQRPQQQQSRPGGQFSRPAQQAQQQTQRPVSQAPRPQAPGPQQPQKGGLVGPCFHCGEMGHLANRCPRKSQQQPQRARVNHVVLEDAQDAADVVIGTFPVSSFAATVLFDSGATHSFISSEFVRRHDLASAPMKNNILVTSPGGEMRAKQVCPKVSIDIRGVVFLANLIVLESKGLDVILGMDWLSKHDGVIQCATKTVQLKHADGTQVEFSAPT